MKDDSFVIRKQDEKESCFFNDDEDNTGLLALKMKKSARIISLGEIPHYSNFFITVHPFIYTGYRIHHSLSDCFKSIFSMHNETSNIWSHLISLIAYVLLMIMMKHIYNTVVYFYLLSTILCFLASTAYHTFNSHSEESCKCMFKIDLFGITIQLLCGIICGIQFMFNEFVTIRYFYYSLFAFLSVSVIIFTVIPIFISEKFAVLRLVLFLTLFTCAFLCSIHWTLVARIEEVEALSKYSLLGFGFIFVGFIFYLSKFPESVYQSKFVDHYLQSHTLWHLGVTGSSISYYYFLINYYLLLNKA